MKRQVFVTAAVLLAVLALAVPPAAAQSYPENTITVTGSGQASGTPDIADINMGVRTISEDVAAAFDQNSAQVQGVINTLTNLGVAQEDIRTTSIYTSFRENFPPSPDQPAPPRTYEVTNDLRVTLRDTNRIGEIIAAAVDAGANNVYGLNFRFSNQDALEQQARTEAMNNARARAEELAAIAGVSVGDIVVITEGGGGFGPMPFAAAGGFGGGGGGGGAPIEAGQLTVSVQVQVTYRIVR